MAFKICVVIKQLMEEVGAIAAATAVVFVGTNVVTVAVQPVIVFVTTHW